MSQKYSFCDKMKEKVAQMLFDPKFTISISIASALNSIEHTRGFLEAANLSNDWIAKMQAKAFVLEAHHTTHIEGTHLSLDQSKKLIAGEVVSNVDAEDVRELLNYRGAFEFVSEYVLSQGIITEGLIREIHRRLVENVRGDSAQPGQYRLVQNYVANSKTKEIIYTPPSAYEVPILMAELVNWLQREKAIPAVLVAGIAQFQLVHIHPFLDGNGRSARLLSTLCLYRSGYDFKKLFTSSEYYDRNRQDYYNALQSVRNNNMDMTSWLEYFCKGLETQLREVKSKGTQAIQLEHLSIDYKLSERQKQLLGHLFEREGDFSIQDYEKLLPGISKRSLQRDLSDLLSKGLIIQKGLKKGSRYSLSRNI